MAANNLLKTPRRIPGTGLPVEILKARFGETLDAFFEAVDKDPQVTEAREALKKAAEQAVKETAWLNDFLVDIRVGRLQLASGDLTELTEELLALKRLFTDGVEAPDAEVPPPPPPPPLKQWFDRYLPPPPPKPRPDDLSPRGQGLELLRPERDIDFAPTRKRGWGSPTGPVEAFPRTNVRPRDGSKRLQTTGRQKLRLRWQ